MSDEANWTALWEGLLPDHHLAIQKLSAEERESIKERLRETFATVYSQKTEKWVPQNARNFFEPFFLRPILPHLLLRDNAGLKEWIDKNGTK